MVIRLAIISHIFEFERRQVLRDTVLKGIPSADVKLEYKFIIGLAKEGTANLTTRYQRAKEDWFYGDVLTMKVTDIPERLSEKRYGALKWVCLLFFFRLIPSRPFLSCVAVSCRTTKH